MDLGRPGRSSRDDRDAKSAFLEVLRARGFNARVTTQPADITAERDGETHYFEIKKTRASRSYFGAATLTEWRAAMEFEDRYTFVVALDDPAGWRFHEYTPEEFMSFSSIPPFKIFFHVPMGTVKAVALTSRGPRALHLTRQRLDQMITLYAGLHLERGARHSDPAGR